MSLEECLLYIHRLYVPEGYSVETLSIEDAFSMTSGYNEGMKASDAVYKIYLHQDVRIINRHFLEDILEIFHTDENIGMIGMVGTEKMAIDGMMWHNYRLGALYGETSIEKSYGDYKFSLEDGIYDVEAIDGFLMVTRKDLSWREDLFDGWDFYDVSQSFEMKRAGYRIVVPGQANPWCVHDDGIISLRNYDYYRKKCMKEYREFF